MSSSVLGSLGYQRQEPEVAQSGSGSLGHQRREFETSQPVSGSLGYQRRETDGGSHLRTETQKPGILHSQADNQSGQRSPFYSPSWNQPIYGDSNDDRGFGNFGYGAVPREQPRDGRETVNVCVAQSETTNTPAVNGKEHDWKSLPQISILDIDAGMMWERAGKWNNGWIKFKSNLQWCPPHFRGILLGNLFLGCWGS